VKTQVIENLSKVIDLVTDIKTNDQNREIKSKAIALLLKIETSVIMELVNSDLDKK